MRKSSIIRQHYGADDSQFGDLRLPIGTGPFPVLVVIHGGFWYDRYGLDLMNHMCEFFTSSGIATWNIEYRRVGQTGGGWPGTLLDVSAAVEYLHNLALIHPIDVTRVVLIGHSAGGHLALWLASRDKIPQGSIWTACKPCQFTRVISLAGVADLHEMWAVRQENSPVANFLGGRPDEVPDRYRLANPKELLPITVSTTLIHGLDDVNVPISVSESYVRHAENNLNPVEFIRLPGVEHFKLIQPNSNAWPHIASVVERSFSQIR